ncbi:MAG: hypothetical protein IKX00_01775 [Bacilli bacterium]|nr:hypothetical protein [Bacilli bacterium]
MTAEKLLIILLIILGLMLLIQGIIFYKRHLNIKAYDTYLPKFDNEIVEKYYYKIYDVITVNYKTSKGRNRQILYKKLIVLCLILFGLFFFIYGSTDFTFCKYLAFISIICCFVFAILIYAFPSTIFREVIPKIVKFVNDSFVYYDNAGILFNEYNSAYSKNYNSYTSSDLVKGTIKNCDIKMSEVHTFNVYKDENDQVRYETVFHGVVAIIDLKNIRNKEINNNESKTNDVVILNNGLNGEYSVKILNNNLYAKFEIGSLFDLGYTNTIEESLHLARNLYNIDYMLNIIESNIDDIITRQL